MNRQFLWAKPQALGDWRQVRRALLALALALALSSPALADGTEEHPTAPQTTLSKTEPPAEAAMVMGGQAHEPMAGSSHGEPHAHGGGGEHSKTASEDAHDHSAHGPNEALLKTGFGRLLVWLGKFHPAAVHFPIAMLLGAALAELLSLRFNNGFFRDAARFSLWAGALGAIGAASLGWFYGGFRLTDEETLLTLHRWNGTGIAVLTLLALWLGERRARQQPLRNGMYRTALFATALLVGLNGYWGGLMVYGPEQHQWPVSPSEQTR